MMRLLPILLLTLAACVSEKEPDSTEFFELNAESYLNDATYRRAQLEDSLWKPELPYARKRLAGYSLGESGWDLLPEISGESNAIGANITHQLIPNQQPKTQSEWETLGQKVFWNMPMRRDAYIEWLLERPELWETVGLQQNRDGSIRGIVQFEDARGNIRAGATCGLCHGDSGMAGRANRDLDLGAGRSLFSTSRGIETPFAEWGPGRVDVTDDDVMDPLQIPDLWGAKHQSHLNASGAVKMSTPAAMAIRFETQYIVGHSMEARPNRMLTWALAAYVLSLEPPQNQIGNKNGESIFARECASCHLPDLGFSGPLVTAEALSSDPQVANSIMRGTGFYKTPTLIGIGDGGPFLHDGSIETLKELLDSDHPRGLELTEEEQHDLLSYLNTL